MVAPTQPALNILPGEQQAVRELVAAIRAAFPHHVLHVAVFGSKARGEARPDSDLDVLLIVAQDTWRLQQALIELGAEIGLKHDVVFDLRIISVARWRYLESIQAGLYRNITQDAIPWQNELA